MRNLLHAIKGSFQRRRRECSGQALVGDGRRNRKVRGMGNRQGSAHRSFKGNRGEGVVEFALVLPIFFLLIFSILDLGHMYYVQLTMENAVRQAGRFAVTGSHLSPPGTTRVDSIIRVAKNAAGSLNVTDSDIQISSVNGGNSGPGRAGGPGDTVTIKITVKLKLITKYIGRFFSGGTNTYTVSTTFRNESFPPSQTL